MKKGLLILVLAFVALQTISYSAIAYHNLEPNVLVWSGDTVRVGLISSVANLVLAMVAGVWSVLRGVVE